MKINFFESIAGILAMTAGAGVLARFFKQPPLLGYIAVGAVISLMGVNQSPEAKHLLELMGSIGVTLLLFLVGLEMAFSQLKTTGKAALATGLGQIIFTSIIGFGLILLLGISKLPALYIAIALTFSSTIIVVKLLSEKRDLHSLYGRIAVGFLLVQDFAAIMILVFISGFGQGNFSLVSTLLVIAKAVTLISFTLLIADKILPHVFNIIGRSQENLFVVAIAWCLGIAALVGSPLIGFGIEIGGFLAGLALSGTLESTHIASKIKPLRDFFLVLFFVSLGAGITISDPITVLAPAIILSIFVLIGNPLIVMIILGFMGYKKRTSFLASVTVAQISEFSLVVMAMAYKVGHVNSQMLSIVALVGAITMTLSTYMIMYANTIFDWLAPYLQIFERKKSTDHKVLKNELSNHVILIGYNRTGSVIYPILEKLKLAIQIVDFDPQVIEGLHKKGINGLFGDISDEELRETLNIAQAKMVISTVSDLEDNLRLIQYIKNHEHKPIMVLTANDVHESTKLYEIGADYVLIPHAAGGKYLAHLISALKLKKTAWHELAKT